MIEPNMTSGLNLKRDRVGARRAWASCLRACLVAAALLWPGAVLAQDDEVKHDARLEGYASKVMVDSESTALMWLLLVFLSMVALGVMFKNAKRTHLD